MKIQDSCVPREISTESNMYEPTSPSVNSQLLKEPYKVLDAPDLEDDFYLTLVDWSAQNQLAVGLRTCMYLWHEKTKQVNLLCDFWESNDRVTAIQWNDKGDLLVVGTDRGVTQLWDVTTLKRIRDLQGHTSKIGCFAWNGEAITSGGRDRTIIHRDIRCGNGVSRRLEHHRQSVCGLKWSPDKQLLASGGDDKQLLIWDLRRPEPVQTYTHHNAAVKALDWSPHQRGLLVSGGATADRCIRIWNTLIEQPMQCIDTGSQVCNVAWSKHSNELVSTHGFNGILDDNGEVPTSPTFQSTANHIFVWDYPSLQFTSKFVGHGDSVLHFSMSPDGESIVTGAGDETLRFWHVFNKTNTTKRFKW